MIDLTYVHNYRILAEYASRRFVVGTKNWLFCDNAKGEESSAIVYSLVEIAKASGAYAAGKVHADRRSLCMRSG